MPRPAPQMQGGRVSDCILYLDDVLSHVLRFFSPAEAQQLLHMPLSRHFHQSVTCSDETWKARCLSAPFSLPSSAASAGRWRALHVQLVRALEAMSDVDVDLFAVDEQVMAVAAALRQFRHVAVVARLAAARLSLLLEHDEAREVARAEGVDALMGVMCVLDQHLQDSELQVACLRCVMLAGRPAGALEGSIARAGTAAESAPRDAYSAVEGAMGAARGEVACAVIRAMRRRSADPDIQAMACWAMVNLGLVRAQKEHLLSAEGPAAVLAAMRAHARSADVQHRALFALVNLSVRAQDAAGGDAPAPVLAAHAGSEEWKREAVLLAVQAMAAFPEHQPVASRACLLLHNLAMDPTRHASMVASDVLPSLAAAKAAHPGDAILQQCSDAASKRLLDTIALQHNHQPLLQQEAL